MKTKHCKSVGRPHIKTCDTFPSGEARGYGLYAGKDETKAAFQSDDCVNPHRLSDGLSLTGVFERSSEAKHRDRHTFLAIDG